MIKVRALEKKEFKEILINPEYVIAVLPVFIEGDLVDSFGLPQGKEKAMIIMSNSQQFVVDTTVNECYLGLNNENN